MPEAIDHYVGRVLATRRLQLGISQNEVAKSVGISFQQLQKYESAANRVSASRLFALCEVLRFPIDLAFPVQESDPVRTFGIAALSDGPALENVIQKMTKAQRRLLLRVAEEMTRP